MRFVRRSLSGLVLLALTLGLLGMAVGNIRSAIAIREAADAARPPGEERVFAVNVGTLVAETARPVLTAYGDLISARRLELRAATDGTVLELAPGFRDGGRVRAGETLYRLDPADAETALALAANDLADAAAEEAEARAALGLSQAALAASERQSALRAGALERARSLSGRGISTALDLETAALALADADQALTAQRQALAEAAARIDRAVIARARADIARDEAARLLGDTRQVAPFDGALTEVTAVLGRRVGGNEMLGLLIDPAALEVAFRVSNSEYARLADPAGGVLPLEVTASLDVDGIALSVPGRIDRAGAAVGAGQTGRLIYARLDAGQLGLLRPGDFLTVRVSEPALADVALVPATAIDPEGRILVLGEGDRLEEAVVTVLRRQGDTVIVGDAPIGSVFVTERQPQLGAGVRVRPVEPAAALESPEGALVRLSPERRASLIAAVRADGAMPEAARARLLAALEADAVPRSMIDRLDPRRTGG